MRASTLTLKSVAPTLETPEESQRERDFRWLKSVAQGDRIALERLYRSYHPRLARFLNKFTHHHETVEEIVNDTFLVVWQNASGFRFASQVSTWIFGIGYRVALKTLRTQSIYVTVNRLDDSGDPCFDPSNEIALTEWVTSGLSRLPPKQRLTLELCYQKGHSIEEIAELTDAPVGTVKARIFHARKNLRRHLTSLNGAGGLH